MNRFTELKGELEALARKIILGDLREELGKELVDSEIAPNIEVEALIAVHSYEDGAEHNRSLGEGHDAVIFGPSSKADEGLQFTSGKPDGKPHSKDYDWVHNIGYLRGAYDRRHVHSAKDMSEVFKLANAYAETERREEDSQLACDARTLGYIKGYVRTADSMEASDGR